MPTVTVVRMVAHAVPMATICTRSQIPLADGRWKLACNRGFYGRADRIQNHLFSGTTGPLRSRPPLRGSSRRASAMDVRSPPRLCKNVVAAGCSATICQERPDHRTERFKADGLGSHIVAHCRYGSTFLHSLHPLRTFKLRHRPPSGKDCRLARSAVWMTPL
jgi:hypothetical protein